LDLLHTIQALQNATEELRLFATAAFATNYACLQLLKTIPFYKQAKERSVLHYFTKTSDELRTNCRVLAHVVLSMFSTSTENE